MITGAYELIDISMWMDEFVFPGDDPVIVEGPFDVVGTQNPEWVYRFSSPTQAGTHVQGPHYFLEHGATVDTVPLARFEGWAQVVDIPARGEDTDVDHLKESLGSVRLDGEIVLFRSGHMDEIVRRGVLQADQRPGLSLAAAEWLIGRGVSMVAIDSVGIESRVTQNFDVNVLFCENDVLLLEGLVNLRALTTKRVWIEAFPLKLRGVEGTPCRAVAKIPAHDGP